MEEKEKIIYIGEVNWRNKNTKFGIKLDDRRRHVYVIGKTGMGKTTLLRNLIVQHIAAGHGVGLIDPHGDLAESIQQSVPSARTNDVVLFDAADAGHPPCHLSRDNRADEARRDPDQRQPRRPD